MRILFLDIETVPTEQFLQENGLLGAQMQLDEAEIVKRLSLSAATAKIVCLAYALEPPTDSPIALLEGEESAILEGFWRLASEADLFVGHNILDFDLRFIWQRSIIQRVRPSREISFARYRSFPVFDTMHEWSRWGRGHVGLDLLARALGIPTPKACLDGSKVYPYFRAGKFADICEYCKRDVETVRQVYRRLTFGLPPAAEGE
ncbi:MAG TPA: ribonuclease H-like domain-containing protein [Candidatus Eisenbacteria bacterium]|nr:ribonuclease H-like domain-containing protein [Candidatus Eisenbacteria bacterium]